MACFIYNYPNDPEGFRRCQERERPLGEQPWFVALPGAPTPYAAPTSPYVPPAAPTTPTLPTPRGAPDVTVPIPGTETAASSCKQKYPEGWFNFERILCQVGVEKYIPDVGFTEGTKKITDKLGSWAQYPVVIILGVAIIIVALLAIARPRVQTIIQSDVGKTVRGIVRGVKGD